MTSLPNRYCQRLGIPVPRVEDVAGRPEGTLFQLVVVALLEAWGSPQTLDDVNARLRGLTDYSGRIDATTVRAWRTDLVAVGPDGLLRLNPASSQIGAFRRNVRRMAATRLRASAQSRDFRVGQLERERQRIEEQRELMAHARQSRRALLYIVPAWFTLDKVHDVLQTALGWTNSHLHMFRFGDERVGMPYELGDLDETYTRSGRIVHLGDLVARGHRRVVYEYDFGDGWTHTIEIDDVRDEEGASLACLDGARACPPEDCGGVHGYHHLLEILFDPTHEEFDDSRQWVGPAFEPERFDLRQVNQQLGRL